MIRLSLPFRLRFGATLVALALTCGGALAAGEAATRVNGTPIEKRQIDLVVKRGLAPGRSETADMRKAATEYLVMQSIAAGEAVKRNLDKAPELNDRIEFATQSLLANALLRETARKDAKLPAAQRDKHLKSVLDDLKARAKISLGAENAAVAATVNGEAVSKARVDAMLKQLPAGANAAEARKMVVDRLVLQTLAAREAYTRGLRADPETATEIDLARQELLAAALAQDFIAHTTIGDDERKAEYERLKALPPATELKLRHILLRKEADARAVLAKLGKDAGAFQRLAGEQSQDPGTRAKGGDLGWLDSRAIAPELGAAVAKLKPGQFTAEPVRSAFGYHVVLLEDTRTAPTPSFEQVRDLLTQRLQQLKLQRYLGDLRAQAKIEGGK